MKTTETHSVDLSTLLRPIAADLERVRCCIEQTLSQTALPFGDFISQLDLCGGKMLRPALVLYAGQCIGPLRPVHSELAAITEMIHLASLLHDDVIDEARTRRGQSSANTLWGNAQAVLLGDFVLSKAFAMGTTLRLPDATAILCQTAEAICTGEIRQNLQRGDWTITEADYLAVIENKTASLFGTCCRLGAMASEAEPSVQDRLQQYGTAIGMVFQMTDDVLDILGSAKEEGKTLGTDLFNEKLTLPVIHWLRQGDGEREKILKQLIRSRDRAALCETLQSGQAIAYTLCRAKEYARTANAALAGLPDGIARQSLTNLVSYILGRV